MRGLDPTAYEAIAAVGRTALAWEVLRRAPGYRAAIADAAQAVEVGGAATGRFVRCWGLHFR